MKKLEDWAKEWGFALAFVLCGAIYLGCVDKGQVYGKGLRQIQGLYGKIYENGAEKADAYGSGKHGGSRDGDADSGQSGHGEEAFGKTQAEGAVPADARDVYVAVEDDYFADAVFIGDSRTVGMFEYGGLEEIATFYASKGLTIYELFDVPIVGVPGQKQKITIEEALSSRQFAKIYLMVGINEMGTGTVDTFLAKYREVLERLRDLQPDAVIFVQGIIKVTAKRSNQGDYITNEGIEARNQGLSLLADDVNIYYLDVNPFLCDEAGGMEESYTFDGVHLKAQYIPIWKEFLKVHAAGV